MEIYFFAFSTVKIFLKVRRITGYSGPRNYLRRLPYIVPMYNRAASCSMTLNDICMPWRSLTYTNFASMSYSNDFNKICKLSLVTLLSQTDTLLHFVTLHLSGYKPQMKINNETSIKLFQNDFEVFKCQIYIASTLHLRQIETYFRFWLLAILCLSLYSALSVSDRSW